MNANRLKPSCRPSETSSQVIQSLVSENYAMSLDYGLTPDSVDRIVKTLEARINQVLILVDLVDIALEMPEEFVVRRESSTRKFMDRYPGADRDDVEQSSSEIYRIMTTHGAEAVMAFRDGLMMEIAPDRN